MPFSPPAAHAQLVLAPLLRRCGVALEAHVTQRGFLPEGGGEPRCTAQLEGAALQPLDLLNRGDVTRGPRL